MNSQLSLISYLPYWMCLLNSIVVGYYRQLCSYIMQLCTQYTLPSTSTRFDPHFVLFVNTTYVPAVKSLTDVQEFALLIMCMQLRLPRAAICHQSPTTEWVIYQRYTVTHNLNPTLISIYNTMQVLRQILGISNCMLAKLIQTHETEARQQQNKNNDLKDYMEEDTRSKCPKLPAAVCRVKYQENTLINTSAHEWSQSHNLLISVIMLLMVIINSEAIHKLFRYKVSC